MDQVACWTRLNTFRCEVCFEFRLIDFEDPSTAEIMNKNLVALAHFGIEYAVKNWIQSRI